MKEADYYKKLEDNKVQCSLCPHNCKIKNGAIGICRVRSNQDGTLISDNYGKVCSAGFDPIEKKPLYHYYPGNIILSVGSIGCNLHCKFCQNWEISQSSVEEFSHLKEYTPEDLVRTAEERKENFGIAYTYNEPTVWYEFMYDIAEKAKTKNLKNVAVTNGFISREPLEKLMNVMDAFSVDLKAFTEDFYKRLTSSKLQPVLETLKTIRKHNKHLEITNLIVTHENDNEDQFRKMINWIEEELGPDTVFHISRYFPTYKMSNEPTPVKTLQKFYHIASEKLSYVYIGNASVDDGQNTYCSKCKELVIKRNRYFTKLINIKDDGSCSKCGNKIVELEK